MRNQASTLFLAGIFTFVALSACGGGGASGTGSVQLPASAQSPVPGASPSPGPSGSPGLSSAIVMGQASQVLASQAFGLSFFPDMHSAMVRQPGGNYYLFVDATVTPNTGTIHGGTTVLESNTLTGGFSAPFADSAGNAVAVLAPSCPQQFGNPTPSPGCGSNFDSDYSGINAVWTSHDGTKLIAQYHGETRTFGAVHNPHVPFYSEIGLAQSSDGGRTWANRQPIIASDNPVPPTSPISLANGTPEGSTILAGDGFIYTYYANFPVNLGIFTPSSIQVARAPQSSDGVAGSWTKLHQGSWTNDGTNSGLGGVGDSLLPVTPDCKEPRQPWVTYSTYHAKYVMVLLCTGGWYYSTAPAPQGPWASPQEFFSLPQTAGCAHEEFVMGCPTFENVILMTPGNANQMTIGPTGVVMFAYTPQWGQQGHTFYEAPYTLGANL